jgi:hypothetical protein
MHPLFQRLARGSTDEPAPEDHFEVFHEKNGALPFQITLQEFAHRDSRGLDEREREKGS